MLRIIVEQRFTGNKKYIECFCISTDTKPVENLVTGSKCTEVDTGKEYLFNEVAASGSEWVEQGNQGAGN